MDRQDAMRVFALVHELSGDLRGRIISERWWMVWIAVGIDMLLVSWLVQALLWNGFLPTPYLIGMLGANVLVIFLIIRFLHRRAGGQRTATETYLWWIWSSEILASFAIMVYELLAGLRLFTTAPLYALLSAIAFSMMAMVTRAYFLICTVVFAGVMVAMSLYPNYQFLIYGASWCAVLMTLGVFYRLTIPAASGRHL